MNYQDFTKIPALPPSNQSVPFYQGFPMVPLYGYDNIEDANQDNDYARHLYSSAVKRIQEEVDEECDKLEYNGSCMYHKYPDKVHLQMISSKIYERVKELSIQPEAIEITSLTSPGCRGGNCSPPPSPRPPYPPMPPCHGRNCPPPPPPRPPRPPMPPCYGRDCIQPRPLPDYTPDGKPNWLKSLVDVMLYNEMNNRRRRYRSRNSWF
ncbi:MAG: hypothetical protein HDT30_14565 [Clostridiales bacterium]|nr:hypothetical protein [Clostridiales bacterium]MDE7422369.1 hypothetical protein [Lachnospiraceae bacterium]